MIAEKMKPFVQNNSAIRMMFEEGNRLRAKYGANKVYDFSLGNPSVPAPDCVREAIIDLVNNEEPTVLHGYMSNAGFEDVRETNTVIQIFMEQTHYQCDFDSAPGQCAAVPAVCAGVHWLSAGEAGICPDPKESVYDAGHCRSVRCYGKAQSFPGRGYGIPHVCRSGI